MDGVVGPQMDGLRDRFRSFSVSGCEIRRGVCNGFDGGNVVLCVKCGFFFERCVD